jgi:hypothetical protein
MPVRIGPIMFSGFIISAMSPPPIMSLPVVPAAAAKAVGR